MTAMFTRSVPLRELAGVTLSLVEDVDTETGKVIAARYSLDFGTVQEARVIDHEASAHMAFESEAALIGGVVA